MTTLGKMWDSVAPPDDKVFLIGLSDTRLCVIARLPDLPASFTRPALRIKDKGDGTFRVRQKIENGQHEVKDRTKPAKYTSKTLSAEDTVKAMKSFCTL